MELKVWVDGIQRVVCGATLDTTCQDVVIALAHAMGRTGRFTLIEKWRDVDRPLAPSECPLRVLYKWGEYAAEVRFVLCQADSDKQRQTQEKGRALKKTGDKSLLSHNFSPQHVAGIADASVKRSLTFSGAHNHLANTSLSLSSSAPTSKFRKTHLGPVPNGDIRTAPPLPQTSRQLPLSKPTGPGSSISNSGSQRTAPHGPPPQQHPVPHPRHKRSSPAPPQGRDNAPSSGFVGSLSSSSSSSTLTPGHQQSSRLSPASPTTVQSHPHPHHQPHSGLQSFPQTHRQSPVKNHEQTHRENYSLPHSRESTPPPLPSSPPPDASSRSQYGHNPAHEHQNTFAAVEASLDSADHSRQASLEIEEYDLDRNFPDTSRDANRGDRPSVSLEYRLDNGVTSGSGGGGQLEGEHAKLVRLVNMQQERLKTQESQISVINTEITALEEREKEYEEQLQVIMEELLLQENRQRDLEPQLTELEEVEWENVLDGEKKCERDLTQQLEACKAKLSELERKLEDTLTREKTLHAEIKAEEERLSSEQQQLQAEETKAAEEAAKLKEEIQKVKEELADLENAISEKETSLTGVDGDLKAVEADLAKRVSEFEEMEKELKTENMKEFKANPVPKEVPRPKDSGETIIKILEGRLSPRPPSVSGKGQDGPASPPFITALASKTQSGVWV